MRLIDADAFKEYLKNAFEEVKHVYTDGGVFAWRITEDFCRDIDDQPTINAEPERKKGKWMRLTDIDGFVQCSSCGAFWDHSIIDTLHFHFCPNCGTDMGGDSDECTN